MIYIPVETTHALSLRDLELLCEVSGLRSPMFKRISDPPGEKPENNYILPVPEALNKAANAGGLRDMQGLAARFSAAAAQRSPE